MNEIQLTEQTLLEQLQKTFRSAQVSLVNARRLDIKLDADLVPSILSHVKHHHGYTHLSHVSCVDWLEEGLFELVFILWNYERRVQMFIKCRISREEAKFVSIANLWDQAATYEREIHEMYGVEFEGNNNLGEFLLEDWDGPPPMRRDFDSEKYAMENFPHRMEARQDARDVRQTISQRSDEDLPDFAKPYTTR